MGYIVRSGAAYLNHNRNNKRLNVSDYIWPDNAAPMVLAYILGLMVIPWKIGICMQSFALTIISCLLGGKRVRGRPRKVMSSNSNLI